MKALAVPQRSAAVAARDWSAVAATAQRDRTRALAELADANAALRESGDEFARLLAVFSKLYPAVWDYSNPEQPEIPQLHVFTNAGELIWPVKPEHLALFEHVQRRPGWPWKRPSAEDRARLLLRLGDLVMADGEMREALEAVR